MEQEVRSAKNDEQTKVVWETPTLETSKVAEEILGSGSLLGDGGLLS